MGRVSSQVGVFVVCRGDGQIGSADRAAGHAQAVEGLGRGDLVHQVQVDVDERGLARFLVNHVGIPDFFEHSAGGQFSSSSVRGKYGEPRRR